ncbi:PASTA domain-containing protein [Mucilaginibacter arboris]|uniref:PASTA domain-containing protein n=1 Tax=Mucilaginibacter arboris TaxID=2682090 RepID=A0A7K1T0L0_9SPHI|nr:PASTA domain-containing protein [Mucilaginibacter arboris]MVN23095.1 PASTA domain-containing protein [Mucilaginibacter arboris]
MSSFFAYLKSKSFFQNLLLAALAVLFVVLAAVFSLNYYTRHGSGIPVPKLIGMQIDHASALLDQQGFQYKIDSVYLPDKDPGTVVQQDPDPATNVKENRTIYLTVITKLAPNINLPDLENITFREAIATISNSGLKLGDTTYRSDIARNRVLEVRFAGEIIKPGTKLPKGSRIDLVLGDGKGASEVDIPDLTNQELDAAKFVISQSGLTLGTVTYEGTITDSTKVVVKSQMPMRTDSTAKTSIGTRINITVTQGSATPGNP